MMTMYHIPWDYIERHWSCSQTMLLLAAAREANEPKRGPGFIARAKAMIGAR